MILEVLEPFVAGKTQVRQGVWIKPLGEGVTAVLVLRTLPDRTFDLVYGVCCAWVPVTTGGGTWPRSEFQSTLHLWVDDLTVDAEARHVIPTDQDVQRLRRAARRAVRQAASEAPRWWAKVATPEGVLAEARRQAADPSEAHDPRARLVKAFTLARLGELHAAQDALRVAGVRPGSRLAGLLKDLHAEHHGGRDDEHHGGRDDEQHGGRDDEQHEYHARVPDPQDAAS